jgi:ferritin
MFEYNWKEEISRGEKLMNYVTKRGGVVSTPDIRVSKSKLNTSYRILRRKLDLETMERYVD